MKRSVIALVALATFSFTTIGAQATPNTYQQAATLILVQDQKKEIKYEDLPEAVKTSFEDSQFSTWEVSKVNEVSGAGDTTYEITISDGTQEGTIRYDKEGNMIQ